MNKLRPVFFLLILIFSTSGYAEQLLTDPGRMFEISLKPLSNTCRSEYRTRLSTNMLISNYKNTPVAVFPTVQPETVVLTSTFYGNSSGPGFNSRSTSTFPAEGLGDMTMTRSLKLDTPITSNTVTGILEFSSTASLRNNLSPRDATRATEISSTSCHSTMSLHGTKIKHSAVDIAYVNSIWTLLMRHTAATTSKTPELSIPPLDEGLALPGPHHAEFLWRKARALFIIGEQLPLDDKDGRLTVFKQGLDVAKEALEADPDNGAAKLFYAANLGRFNTTHGTIKMIFGLDDLEKAMLETIETDSDYSLFGFATIGEAHNGLAQMYRLIPDSFLAKMFLGIRGNIQKSNDHNRKSVQIQDYRGDYLKELGLSLMCTGKRGKNPEATREGKEWLEKAIASNTWAYDSPEIDKEHMRSLLRHPDHACSYSRDKYKPDEGMGNFMKMEQ